MVRIYGDLEALLLRSFLRHRHVQLTPDRVALGRTNRYRDRPAPSGAVFRVRVSHHHDAPGGLHLAARVFRDLPYFAWLVSLRRDGARSGPGSDRAASPAATTGRPVSVGCDRALPAAPSRETARQAMGRRRAYRRELCDGAPRRNRRTAAARRQGPVPFGPLPYR